MFNDQFFFYKFDNFRNILSAILVFFFDKPSFFFVNYCQVAAGKAGSPQAPTTSPALADRLDTIVLLSKRNAAPIAKYLGPVYLQKNNCLLLNRVTYDDSIYMDNILPVWGSNLKLIINDVSYGIVSRHLNIPLLR